MNIKKAADFWTWFIWILNEVIILIVCVVYLILAIELPDLFVIFGINLGVFIAYSLIGFIGLSRRQIDIDDGTNYVKWGVLTILFFSIPGGILTICIPRKRPKYVSHKTIEEYASRNELKKEETEFIFVVPNKDHPIEIGSTVLIVEGFYSQTLGRRVPQNTIGEVMSIQGQEATIEVDESSIKYRTSVSFFNLKIKIKNPNYVDNSQINPHSAEENNDGTDKFEAIKKYKELLDLNIITQEEFDKKKKELLGD